MRKQIVFITGLLFVALADGAVHADVIIYNNLSTTTQGFGSVSDTAWEANRFNSDATNVLLTSATLTLFAGNQGSGTFFVKLYSDTAGVPGISLATLFLGANPFPGPFSQSGDILFGGLSQPLAPSTNYWIVVGESSGSVLDIRWGSTSLTAGTGSGFQTIAATTPNSGGGWTTSGAPHKMQLTATVPEPGSALLVTFVGGLLLVRRQQRLPSR
jgi:hypothetical protein